MRLHTVYGAEIIGTALEGIEGESYLTIAKEIAEGHHEKYDGSGYPHHIKGTDIPLSARLMAVADVFDALMSKRPYKAPMSLEQATSIIVEGKGKHFDPDAVDAFLGEQAQKEIKETLATITED
jgi:response regulator RpfG family c-di-GMP phosphodiesterase